MLSAPKEAVSLAWLCTGGEAKACGPHPPRLETGSMVWHQQIRNSIRQLLEIDFPSRDLISCFTSRGDQTSGRSQWASSLKGLAFLFLFHSFSTVHFKGNF